MNDSNHTLRFARTYREATGQEAIFEDASRMDRLVGYIVALAVAFALGLIVGGM